MLVRLVGRNVLLVISRVISRMAKGGIIRPTDSATKRGLLAKFTRTLVLEILSEGEVFLPVKGHFRATKVVENPLKPETIQHY
jgi:hypothetical protein